MGEPNYEIIWRPQAGPQTHLITCPVEEVLFGGSRGGGKTDAVIGKFVYHANQHGNLAHGVIFRRSFKQLEEVLRRTRELYPKIGANYSVTTQTWSFPNGATLKLRHLDNDVDAQAYQGHSYNFLVFEEATNWPTPSSINLLRATLRSGAGVPSQLILTANPGGPGHNWVKARFIDPHRPGYKIINDPDSNLQRVYIPSRLADNVILTENDPTYAQRLKQTGAAHMVRAWLEGDWDIVAGGFFDDVFRPEKHLLKPFPIPAGWPIVVGFDWGYSAPASLSIFTRVADWDESLNKYSGGRILPRGSLILVRELYTVAREESGIVKPNVGLKWTNEELGGAIARRLKTLPHPRSAAADPSIFSEQGGPSIYERMRVGARAEGYNLVFSKADNNRTAGWGRVRELLRNAAEDKLERPGLFIFDTCEHFLRTVPVLPADRLTPDDVDTDSEDHAADSVRYACMVKGRVPLMTKFLGG